MQENTKYDEINIMELVVLPMSNLKATLEAILNRKQDIPPEELLRGLRLVHQNASSILQHLSPTHADSTPTYPVRRVPQILRSFSEERDALEFHLEAAD